MLAATWDSRIVFGVRVVIRSEQGPPRTPRFIGDYQGLAATSRSIIATFVVPGRADGSRQQILVSRLRIR